MKKLIFILAVCTPIFIQAQFGAPPGDPGSTAIHKDSSIFIGWATGIDIVRGLIDIADPSATDNGTNVASYGDPSDALGQASGISTNVVSLGDSGYATLTFDYAIVNRPGYDFAVFENGFGDGYIELAFVEVSSDGINFVRFPSTSLTQVSQQIGPFETMDLEQMYNLAGKYRVGYGTPFDLEDLADSSGIDLQNITHIRIVDAIGTIDPAYATYDAQGSIINDPYPTDFAAGGFDLDGVGVIHFEGDVGVENHSSKSTFSVYPNPLKKGQNIQLQHLPKEAHSLKLIDLQGRVVLHTDEIGHELETGALFNGLHLLVISNQKGEILEKVKIIIQ